MRTLTNSAGFCVPVEGMSIRQIAALDGVKGSIGKTSITELVSGKREESKGWKIVDVPEKPIQKAPEQSEKIARANRYGVEYCGQGKQRQRLPMVCKCTITAAGKAWLAQRGNLPDSLPAAALRQCQGKEYSEIAKALGWSRDLVGIKLAPMRTMGFVIVEKSPARSTGERMVNHGVL